MGYFLGTGFATHGFFVATPRRHHADAPVDKLFDLIPGFSKLDIDAEGLKKAIEKLKELKKDFWTNLRIPGNKETLNVELEKALRLADFIGLDTCAHIMEVMAEGLNNPRYRACPLLKQLVTAGRLGDKTKHGVFMYE